MLAECVVIIIILSIAGYMFIRSKRKAWFPGVFPLMVVPALNIIFPPRHLDRLPNGFAFRIAIYAVAFIVSSAWLILWSKSLKLKKSRYGYVICSTLYNIVLIIVLIAKGTRY